MQRSIWSRKSTRPPVALPSTEPRTEACSWVSRRPQHQFGVCATDAFIPVNHQMVTTISWSAVSAFPALYYLVGLIDCVIFIKHSSVTHFQLIWVLNSTLNLAQLFNLLKAGGHMVPRSHTSSTADLQAVMRERKRARVNVWTYVLTRFKCSHSRLRQPASGSVWLCGGGGRRDGHAQVPQIHHRSRLDNRLRLLRQPRAV